MESVEEYKPQDNAPRAPEHQKQERSLRQRLNRAYKSRGVACRLRTARGRRTFHGHRGHITLPLGHYRIDSTGRVLEHGIDLNELALSLGLVKQAELFDDNRSSTLEKFGGDAVVEDSLRVQ
jgi:hypothetical protein